MRIGDLPYLLVIGVLLFFAHQCQAFEAVKLDEVTINYRSYLDGSRHYLLPPGEKPKEALDLHVNTDLFKIIGFDNLVNSVTTDAQYRVVGWKINLYVRVNKYIDAGFYHWSQHLLDTQHPYQKFPSENAIQINLKLYQSEQKRESLF